MSETASTNRVIDVGIGELYVTSDPGAVLLARALGSCVAVCAYDHVPGVAGMAHTLLPFRHKSRTPDPGARFVGEAIPLLLRRMEELGAVRRRLVVKIVGGADLINTPGANGTGIGKIGERNAEAARVALAAQGLRIHDNDTGGSEGRSARLSVDCGRLMVSRLGGEDYEL